MIDGIISAVKWHFKWKRFFIDTTIQICRRSLAMGRGEYTILQNIVYLLN